MRLRRLVLTLAALVAVTLACALPGAPSPAPVIGPLPEAPSEFPAGTVGTPSTELAAIEPLPPTSLTEAIQAKVEAGELTYEESLILGLDLLLGETDPETVFTQVPTEMEGTGVIHDAQLYLRSGANPSVQAEIDRMLRILAPLPEALSPYSLRESARSARGPGLSAPLEQEKACADLWAEGFPTPQPDEKHVMCFKYLETKVGASTVEVFYPITTLPEGFTVAFADAAMKAVVDSLKTYASLAVPGKTAVLRNVQVVFSLLPSKSGAFALTPTKANPDPCQIVMFPLSMTRVSGGPGGAPPEYALFQQNVAHEMFHCFQIWNFPEQSGDDTWDVQDWWAEATAEYFSNVVYPATDDEWRWMNDWVGDTATVPIFEESYENFGLFQYLGNRLGNNGVLALIQHMKPSVLGDKEAQAAQLATFPNIQAVFSDYARDYVDGKIADSSKKLYPTAPPLIQPPENQVDISQAGVHNLDAPPFTLIRYKLTFAPGHEYKLTTTVQGGDGVHASRPTGSVATWGDLPASVKPACGPTEFYLVMTTTQPSSAPYRIRIDVTKGDAIGCDPCLVGTWDLNIPSFVEYSEAPFAETPGLYNHDSAGGLWRYRFRPSGTFTAEFDFFSSSTLHQPGGGFGADIDVNQVITIVGPGEGTYLSDGLSNLTFSLVEDSVGLSSTTTINGEDMGDLFGALSGYGFLKGSDSMVYSCDAEAGILQLDVAPQAGLPPLQYDRISTDPNKP